MNQATRTLLFDQALTPQGWACDVAIDIEGGDIVQVRPGFSADAGRAVERVRGCALPGMPNLHSHAHQRAMAGLAERAGDRADSFWSWRETMYRQLARINPDHAQAIAAQLYVEMLRAGYTSVCEFQYLHHQPDGSAYSNPAEMSLRLREAARVSGIGITLLPVLYRYSGFGAQSAGAAQRRFVNDADGFIAILEQLIGVARADADCALGIAPHSLRAVDTALLQSVLDALGGMDGMSACPVHIHIAEQTGEVQACLEATGLRPVQWLLANQPVDARWCLVHATHMLEEETRALAASGAVAGLCPTTEANLGDGFFDAVRYQQYGGRFGIGSDSHISVSPVEELRWLEYAQRLRTGERNVLAGGAGRSTGHTLFTKAAEGGGRASGRAIGRLAAGCRADLVVLDTDHPLLYRRSDDALLDAWLFSGNQNPVREVYVGGIRVIRDGRHDNEKEIARQFRQALDALAE